MELRGAALSPRSLSDLSDRSEPSGRARPIWTALPTGAVSQPQVRQAPGPRPYRGRFAPSPSGPLHFGSLVTALGSYLDAKANGGEWWVRIDDLDPPRVVPGAADDILRTLEIHGFQWDGPVVYQSARNDAYRNAFNELEKIGAIYPCACTRREIADSVVGKSGQLVYPGTCRTGLPEGRSARAYRIWVEDRDLIIPDRLRGEFTVSIAREAGDFIILRADGLFAYQLAAVVDDDEYGMTDVVRGGDLLDSTARQVYLYDLLDKPVPRYLHLPIAVNELGEKLSKQTLAPSLDKQNPIPTLMEALRFLGQDLPLQFEEPNPGSLLAMAIAHWKPENIPEEHTRLII